MKRPGGGPRALGGVLALALLQAACAAAAAGLFDRGHRAAAVAAAVFTPLAVGWCGGRLRLSLPATLLSYAILPLAAAAYLKGVPGLVLQRAAVLVLWAAPPTTALWWLGSRRTRSR